MLTRKDEILHIVNVLASPTEVFLAINEDPKWRAPFLFYIITGMLIGWARVPLVVEPMRRVFESSFGGASADAAIHGVWFTVLFSQVVAAPLAGIIRWFVLASCIVWLVHFDQPTGGKFRKAFCLVAYAESIFIFQNLITVLVLYVRGVENIVTSADMSVIRGADWILADAVRHPFLLSLLAGIQPFSVWYVATLACGIRAVSHAGLIRSLCYSSISWGVWVILGSVSVLFGEG